ncbi:MAG: hypothetical protein IJE10_08985 [Clostridia bacterium]|nr:hypothetical protein [Clostridia bacterium]
MEPFKKVYDEVQRGEPETLNKDAFEDFVPLVKKKKGKTAARLAIVVLLVLGLACGAFYLWSLPETVTEASVQFNVSDAVLNWQDNGEICVIEAGQTPADIEFVSGDPEAYEVEISYVKKRDSYPEVSETTVEDSHVFEMDYAYIIGFDFKAKEGYKFTEDTKFKVPLVDNISGGEEAQYEIVTRAADLRYKPVIVGAAVEMNESTYTMGKWLLTAHVTGLSKTIENCKRFWYLYSFQTPEELYGNIEWKLYARSPDGTIHEVATFACGKGSLVSDCIELDETLDINGFFAMPSSGNITQWDTDIRIQRIYAEAE